MKQDKQDRRSQRTRHLINNAMLELLFERRYETITVQDILDQANVGRSTFYTHYYDMGGNTECFEQVHRTVSDHHIRV